jgi:hypothetical protein
MRCARSGAFTSRPRSTRSADALVTFRVNPDLRNLIAALISALTFWARSAWADRSGGCEPASLAEAASSANRGTDK